jgi:hypothetical protein
MPRAYHISQNLLKFERTMSCSGEIRQFILEHVGEHPRDIVTVTAQAFADEVFRVFVMAHPKIALYAGQANTAVLQMIRHVAGARADGLLADEEE